jgi:predicted DNA-binding protein YlxM (UPF0122 family)
MKGIMITNYSKYRVTSEGDVYSYAQLQPKKLTPRIVSQSEKGYVQVSLYNDECKRHPKTGQKLPDQIYVHHLVWEAFNGEFDKKIYEIDHIDDNPRNNKLSNLQILTRRNNMRKYNKKKHGSLPTERVDYVKELFNDGMSITEIANKLECSYTTIYRIIKNKRQIYKTINGVRKYTLIDYNWKQDKNI